jgi:hypothetical protein
MFEAAGMPYSSYLLMPTSDPDASVAEMMLFRSSRPTNRRLLVPEPSYRR